MMGAPPNLPPTGGGMSLVPGMGSYPPGMVPQFMTVPPPGFGSFKPVSIFPFQIFLIVFFIFLFLLKRTENHPNGPSITHLMDDFIIIIRLRRKVHGSNRMCC